MGRLFLLECSRGAHRRARRAFRVAACVDRLQSKARAHSGSVTGEAHSQQEEGDAHSVCHRILGQQYVGNSGASEKQMPRRDHVCKKPVTGSTCERKRGGARERQREPSDDNARVTQVAGREWTEGESGGSISGPRRSSKGGSTSPVRGPCIPSASLWLPSVAAHGKAASANAAKDFQAPPLRPSSDRVPCGSTWEASSHTRRRAWRTQTLTRSFRTFTLTNNSDDQPQAKK